MAADAPSQAALLAALEGPLVYTMGFYATITPFAAFVTGLIIMQAIRFLSDPDNGSRQSRILVIICTITITIQSVFEITGHTTQSVVIATDPTSSRILAPWTSIFLVLGSCIVQLLVEAHFARVVYRMVRFSKPLQLAWAGVATAMLLVATAAGLGSVVGFVQLALGGGVTNSSGVFTGYLLVCYCLWLTTAAVFDTVLSAALVSRFLKDVRNDGYNATNSFLVKLAVTTLEMFTLTAVTAIIAVICAFLTRVASGLAVTKLNLVCYVCTVLVSRFYTTSLIYSLERRQIRHKHSVAVHSSAQLGGFKRTHITTTAIGAQHPTSSGDHSSDHKDDVGGGAVFGGPGLQTVPIELSQRRPSGASPGLLGVGGGGAEGVTVVRDTVTHYEQDSNDGNVTHEKERRLWHDSHDHV